MKQKETALRILLKKGASTEIKTLAEDDMRIIFALAEILVTTTDEKLYHNAALALGNLGVQGLPFLIHTIATHTNPAVRLASILGLGQSNHSSTVPTLIEALQDSQPNVRQKAARALGQIGDGRAINPLIDLLEDSHPYPRENAIIALSKLGSARALAPLAKMIQNEEDASLVATAKQAITQIQEASGVQLPN